MPPLDETSKRRLARVFLVLAAVALFVVLSRHWPRDQGVHIVLGDRAARVVELRLSYRAQGAEGEDAARSTTFHYAPGAAPRVVTHELRLPDGDYAVNIEIATSTTSPEPAEPDAGESQRTKDNHAGEAWVTIERRVTLTGGTVSIDVARELPKRAPE